MKYYKIVKKLGKGAFGKVLLGIHIFTGKYVGIKFISKDSLKDDLSRKKVIREIYILKKIKHDNIIRLLEVFETLEDVIIVMEYANGGDLLKYTRKNKRLEENEAAKIFKQIVYGLAHLHSRNILHHDIKLANILLTQDGKVKIADFGISKITNTQNIMHDRCGTPIFVAPEIVAKKGYKGFTSDYWSLGILLYRILCEKMPFKENDKIEDCMLKFPYELSDNAKNLINGLLKINPDERLSIPEILHHPWLNKITSTDFVSEKSFPLIHKDKKPSIGNINIRNLLIDEKHYGKLSSQDYKQIVGDVCGKDLDNGIIDTIESFGYNRINIKESISKEELNHITGCYNLLTLN